MRGSATWRRWWRSAGCGGSRCSGCRPAPRPRWRYAARHPEQVDKLLLYGGYSRGRNKRTDQPAEPERGRLMTELIKTGWGQDNPAFRRVFTTLLVSDVQVTRVGIDTRRARTHRPDLRQRHSHGQQSSVALDYVKVV